jgi:hypothetical protein
MERVTQVKVTLEKPHRGGALLLRRGTDPARRNPDWNPGNPNSGPQYIAGDPIVYGPLIAGDPVKDSCIMPLDAAKDLFGDWDAPEVERPGARLGYVKWIEKERLARSWGGYKRVKANGTMTPDLTPVGPPEVPYVAIRPVDARGNVDESAPAVYPRSHFGFDDATYELSAEGQEANELDAMRAQIAKLTALVEAKGPKTRAN